jgi:hypothetical protein
MVTRTTSITSHPSVDGDCRCGLQVSRFVDISACLSRFGRGLINMHNTGITGSCLCGAMTYKISPPYRFFKQCHCSRCRKSTGSAYAANILLPNEQFSWLSGQDQLRRYEVPEAASYNNFFCDTCGSQLPSESRDGRWVLVPAGTLDVDPGATPDKNIFWESRAPWFANPDSLPKFCAGG